jgi:hypothetical protein
MRKYIIMFMLVIGVSCIKIPKDQPIWWVTLRVPIGDSVVTVYDVLKEDPEKYEIIYDSLQPIIDSVYMLQTHLEENVQVQTPPQYQIFYASLRRSLPKEIDTINSLFRSILFTMIGKVKFKGNASDTVSGYIHFTPWYWDTLTDTLQKWTRTGDTIVYFTFPPGPVDTVVQTVYDSFPFGPHKLEIRPYVTTGTAYFDTVLGVKRVLMAAQLLGDIIFTVEDTFETEKEIRKAAEKGQIARVRVVLNIRHSLPAEAYGTIYLRGLEWPPDSVIDEFPFYAAPKDTITGKSIGIMEWSDTIELSQHHFNVFQDSLVFYKVRIFVPQQDKAYLRSRDSLRVNGWIEATVLTDIESLEE